MKLKELKAAEIITSIMGDRGMLKNEEELAVILKKRLTKKERFALNAKISGADMGETLSAINVDEARFEVIVNGAIKKIKNESVHKEFYVNA